MVLSSISAYISRSYTTGHAFVTDNNASMFVVGENLAWGYSDPFKGWYDEEKKAYKKNKDRYAAGHYFNIKEKSYTVTGFAMANPDNSWLVSEQSFSFDDEGSKNAMSVGDFEKAYNKYLKSGINSQLNKAKKAQASASKAYKKASSKYNSARDALLKLSQPKLSGKAGKKSVTLTWTKVTGATNYCVYRATSEKGKYKKIATVKSAKYVNKKLRSGKKYFYKVRGYRKVSRKNIYSKYSTVKNFKVR
ncbi:MAG: hypothetical protein DUD27_03805 [Lachnospiraceae bacterium]|nr:MAG: hypothetical protein DUD27_03805 [Lachnospiraceae bacterium]